MSQSALTRKQFVQQEIAMGIEAQGIPGVDFVARGSWQETFDPDVVEAIQKRAEWNAQAAERAGVTWRQEQEPKDDPKWPAGRMVLWSVPNSMSYSAYRILEDGTMQYSWEEAEHGWSDMKSVHPAMQELARVLVAEYHAKQQVAKSYTHNPRLQGNNSSVTPDLDNWADCPNAAVCGNKVSLWAGTGLCHPCSVRDLGKKEMDKRYEKTHRGPKLEPATEFQVPDALTMDIIERVNQHGRRLDQHKASIGQLAEEVTRLREMARLDRVNQKTAEEDLNEKIETIGANLQGLMDSIGKAHSRINELFTEKARIDQRVDRANQRLDKIEGPVIQGVQNVTLGLGNKIDNLNLAVASLIGRVCKLESVEVAKGKGDPE